MKKFSIQIIGVFISLLLLLLLFDFSYTTIYENAAPRTKFQYLRSLKNSKVNYIFLGSSRVENGINPIIIDSITTKKSVNLGYQAAKLGDIYTVLKLLKNYKIASDTVFIQIDYSFVLDGHSINLPYEMTPFIKESPIIKDYFLNYIKENPIFYYVPFWRYIGSDQKIGLREVFANAIGKKTKVVANKGFSPLEGIEFQKNTHRSLPTNTSLSNVYFEKIKKYAALHDIKIVFFCAPFCKHTHNLNYVKKLKTKIPELYDFSCAIKEDDLFVNCFHLNEAGAKKFTQIFADKILKNTKKH